MAHTIQGNEYTTFHFNGDFRGDVTIVRFGGTHQEQKMQLPMEALNTLFVEMIRRKRIEAIETMSDRELIDSATGK